jgi:hypothetical protein
VDVDVREIEKGQWSEQAPVREPAGRRAGAGGRRHCTGRGSRVAIGVGKASSGARCCGRVFQIEKPQRHRGDGCRTLAQTTKMPHATDQRVRAVLAKTPLKVLPIIVAAPPFRRHDAC